MPKNVGMLETSKTTKIALKKEKKALFIDTFLALR